MPEEEEQKSLNPEVQPDLASSETPADDYFDDVVSSEYGLADKKQEKAQEKEEKKEKSKEEDKKDAKTILKKSAEIAETGGAAILADPELLKAVARQAWKQGTKKIKRYVQIGCGTILALMGLALVIFGFTQMSLTTLDANAVEVAENDPGGDLGDVSEIRKKIVQIAKGEIGVCGTGFEENKGEPQKYTRYTCGLGSPTTGSSWRWCAGFTGWVYGHAGVDFPRTCLANSFMSGLKYKYSITSGIPKPGDVVQRNAHVGIVYKVEGTKLYTIEGNAGRCVQILSYPNYGRNRGGWINYGNSFEPK